MGGALTGFSPASPNAGGPALPVGLPRVRPGQRPVLHADRVQPGQMVLGQPAGEVGQVRCPVRSRPLRRTPTGGERRVVDRRGESRCSVRRWPARRGPLDASPVRSAGIGFVLVHIRHGVHHATGIGSSRRSDSRWSSTPSPAHHHVEPARAAVDTGPARPPRGDHRAAGSGRPRRSRPAHGPSPCVQGVRDLGMNQP